MENKKLFSQNTGENIYHCVKCGLCLAHCPVYKEVLLEEAAPRGKVQLSRALEEGTLELNEEVKKAFFSTCLLCGSCVANCPSGVHGDHLFSGVRWRAKQKYGIDWKKKLMFQLLANKWLMSKSAALGGWARRNFSGPWIEKKIKAGALSVDRIPPFNMKAFSDTVPEVTAPKSGKAKAKVLYFHGCATNFVFGDIGNAVVDVLSKMDVEVITPKDQGCCGLPIFLSGDRETSVEIIREVLKIFARADVDAVLVDCGTCGAALKNEYPHLLKDLRELGEKVTDEEIKAAELLSSKTMDVTVFIDAHKDWLPKLSGNGKKIRVTYHDPCHLVKGQKVSAQPRNILKSIPDVEYVEMAAAGDCCGGGGSFQVEHAETSAKITKRKIDNAEATGAQVVATCCPGCNVTIGNHLDPAKGMRTMHPVQLLQMALNR
jgi:glycolate oxidase iron-sulfur subunit